MLFLCNIGINIVAILMFNLLPKPEKPKDFVEVKEDAKESFYYMLSMFKDERIIKMYGIFINSGCAAGIAQGMLIIFYSDILKEHSTSEQLRLSSMVMVVYGFGAMAGGPVIGLVNDKFGGGKSVSRVNILLHILIYGSLIICNEIHTFNIMCFISGFLIGSADSSQMT